MPLQSIPQPIAANIQEIHRLISTLRKDMEPILVQDSALTKSIATRVGVSPDNFIEFSSYNIDIEQ